MGRPKLREVSCSIENCDGVAKQNQDTPLCRKCQIRLSTMKSRQSKKKEEYKPDILEQNQKNKEWDVKNAILYPDEIYTRVFQSLSADCERFIDQGDPDPDMIEEARANPVVISPDIKRWCQLVLLQDESNLTHQEKRIRMQRIEREYNMKKILR